MRHTRTHIINAALMRLGAHGVTASFQDAPAAQAADAAYARALSRCLSLHAWNFALRHCMPAAASGKGGFGFRHARPLPADCLRVVEVADGNGTAVPYTTAGTALYADPDPVQLTYVSAEPETFPDAFADALAWRTAAEIAPYVQQGGAQAAGFIELFEHALDRARTENDAAHRPRRTVRSAFLDERRVHDGGC